MPTRVSKTPSLHQGTALLYDKSDIRDDSSHSRRKKINERFARKNLIEEQDVDVPAVTV